MATRAAEPLRIAATTPMLPDRAQDRCTWMMSGRRRRKVRARAGTAEEAAGTAHQGDHSDLDPGRARLVEHRDDAGVGMGDEHRPPARAVQSRQQAQGDPLGTARLRRVRVVDHRPTTLRGLGGLPSRRPDAAPEAGVQHGRGESIGQCRMQALDRAGRPFRCRQERVPTSRDRDDPLQRRPNETPPPGASAATVQRRLGCSLGVEPKEAHRSPALRHVIGRQGRERLVIGLVGDRLGRVHELDPGRQ